MANTLSIRDDQFFLGDAPFRILGGAMHYPRVPRALWRDRLQKLIDLGCNTLETYVFWNAHEPYPGRYDFDGMLDVAAYVELAGAMGLHVLVRPGPYVCAEWDMGALPWWLLNERDVQLRSSDPNYLDHVKRWFDELLPRLTPLQATRGGPVLAMQVENEYGYYGNDAAYLRSLHDHMRAAGVDVPLFTSDGTYQRLTIANGGLDGVLRTANFGSDAPARLATLREFQKTGPLMCAEFWVGWFDEWRTGKHNSRKAEDCAAELDKLLVAGASAVIYMFHGGTNFGFTAGGNLSDSFKPFVTSYDYDALLSESGDVTPKYEACRAVIAKHAKASPRTTARATPAPTPGPKRAYGTVALTEVAALDDALAAISAPVETASPLPMERLGQGRGFTLYRTTLPAIVRGERLVLRGMHDWCNVHVDGRSIATWYRNDPMPEMKLDFAGATATLDVLVHNLARSNFGHRMGELKGITDGVYVGATRHDERKLFGWQNWPLPLDHVAGIPFRRGSLAGPAFFRGTFEVEGTPADTFLALPGFDLGCVFLNGFNLGRYWNAGPQRTLYVPAPLLRSGENELVLFEAVGTSGAPKVELRDMPQLG